MIKKATETLERTLAPVGRGVKKLLSPVIAKLDNTEPDVLKRWLNRLLLVEIIFFIGVAIYRHSISSVFSDAFGATSVGGLYSFIAPLIDNFNDPLMGLDKVQLTDNAFLMWILSGFGYMLLLKYNDIIGGAGYGKVMQIIHSIFFCMFIGVVGAPIALLIIGAIVLPVQPLWATGSTILRILSVVLGAVGMGLLGIMLVYTIKALISTLKDFVKFYIFLFILMIVVYVLSALLSKLIGIMSESALLSPIINWIGSLLASAGASETSGAGLATNATFIKTVLGVCIFLMYNVSAVLHGDGLVV